MYYSRMINLRVLNVLLVACVLNMSSHQTSAQAPCDSPCLQGSKNGLRAAQRGLPRPAPQAPRRRFCRFVAEFIWSQLTLNGSAAYCPWNLAQNHISIPELRHMSPSSCIAGVLWLGLVLGCAQAESMNQGESATSDQAAVRAVTPARTEPETTANTGTSVAIGPDSLEADWQPQAKSREWKSIVLHHSATEVGSVESIHAEHLQRRDAAGTCAA